MYKQSEVERQKERQTQEKRKTLCLGLPTSQERVDRWLTPTNTYHCCLVQRNKEEGQPQKPHKAKGEKKRKVDELGIFMCQWNVGLQVYNQSRVLHSSIRRWCVSGICLSIWTDLISCTEPALSYTHKYWFSIKVKGIQVCLIGHFKLEFNILYSRKRSYSLL